MNTLDNPMLPLSAAVPPSHVKHLIQLVYRRLLSFYRDKTDLSITFGQAPLLALAFFFVFQKIVTVTAPTALFLPLRGYLTLDTVSIIIFLAVLTAVWFGSSKAIVEIPSTQILYQQERLTFLRNFDYIASIFIALAIISFGQVLLFAITFHALFVVLPAWLNPFDTGLVTEESASLSLWQSLMPLLFIKFTLLLWLTALASIAVAMAISVFTPSRAAANAILPFLLILQILFAGSVIKPIIFMNPIIHGVANLMVSRWGFEGVVLLFERDLNLAMPRQETYNDHDFLAFTFTKGIKKLDPQAYVTVVGKTGIDNLTQNPATVSFWQDSLKQAADVLKYGDKPLTETVSKYIDGLAKANWNPTQLTQLLPEVLANEAKKQFVSSYTTVCNKLFTLIDKGGLLTDQEKKVWEEMVRYDSRMQLFRRATLVEIDETLLTADEKQSLGNKLIPSTKLFRATINTQTIWMVLSMMTLMVLTLGGGLFTFKRKF